MKKQIKFNKLTQGKSIIRLKKTTRESNRSVIWLLYALKMSADVMHAVLHTALLGFFSDFTTSGTTFSLLRGYRETYIFQSTFKK